MCLTERSVQSTKFNCMAVMWSTLGLRALLKVEITIAFLSVILQFKVHLYLLLNLRELNYLLHKVLIRHYQ